MSAPHPPITRSIDDAIQAPRRPSVGFDPLLLIAAVGLGVCSLVTLRGATRNDVPGQPHYYLERQGLYLLIGLVAMFALSRLDYSRLRELKYGLYTITIGSILLVFAFGSTARGSQRAIQFPFFSFQASELGKVVLCVVLAAVAVDRSRRIAERSTTARVMLLALVPAMLVIAQPDLGTGIVYVVVALAILFVAGAPWTHFAGLFAVAAASMAIVLAGAPAVGVQVLKPYQTDRLTAFLNPSSNPADQGYQQDQSRIAIGSGQKTGRGPHATQTRLQFLPESRTDFIFAVVGETYGFVGGALVLSLYALLLWRGLRILTMAKNLYGAMIAGGIVSMLLFQVFVNVGMTMGIAPITGIPLPLMSYGGSSVIVTFLAIGLLQSIYAQGRLTGSGKKSAIPI